MPLREEGDQTKIRSVAYLSILAWLLVGVAGTQSQDPLPSWNKGTARQAILNFVHTSTDPSSPNFVPPKPRIAGFDQDGTTWVEHPMYAQLQFVLDRLRALAPEHPEWKTTQPFQAVFSGDKAGLARLSMKELETLPLATHNGMTVDEFHAIVVDWPGRARDKRRHRPYTELVYQPMLEVMHYLRANGYKTYIVTGGGQAFVRVYADRVYGIPPEQVIGSALETQFTYDTAGRAVLTRPPKLLLNNDLSGKPEDIYLFTGRRPHAAFGNSAGDRQTPLMMLVLHDDARRQYAYGPARELPILKSARSPRHCVTKPQPRNGSSSA